MLSNSYSNGFAKEILEKPSKDNPRHEYLQKVIDVFQTPEIIELLSQEQDYRTITQLVHKIKKQVETYDTSSQFTTEFLASYLPAKSVKQTY